jgi:hypothetical protein
MRSLLAKSCSSSLVPLLVGLLGRYLRLQATDVQSSIGMSVFCEIGIVAGLEDASCLLSCRELVVIEFGKEENEHVGMVIGVVLY